MVYFFNGHPIYRPNVVKGQDITNYNINATIDDFKLFGYFENIIRNIFRWIRSKLLVPNKTTTFFRFEKIGRLSARHKTCWILSPPKPQFKNFSGFRNLSQTFWYRLNPITIESPMSIFSKVFLLTWSSDYDEYLANSSLKTLLRELLAWYHNQKFKRFKWTFDLLS